MGQLLQNYLTLFGTQLEAISGIAREHSQGPGSATGMPTFTDPRSQVRAPMEQMTPAFQPAAAQTFPAGTNPTEPLQFGEPTRRGPGERAAGQSGFTRDLNTAPAPTFQDSSGINQIDTSKLPKRAKSVEDIKNFDDLMAAASPEQVDAGIDIMEQQLGGPEGLRRQYQQVTGKPPDPRMSRREIGSLLLEFGLRTLAYSGDGGPGGLAAVGRAGAETLGTYRAMQEAKSPAAQTEAQRKVKAEELQNQLLQAQIEKAQQDPTDIRADADGNLVLINKNSGGATPVLDAQGNPVSEGKDAAAFASQVDRQAYEAAFCDMTDPGELKKCKQRALAFSKGGATEIAFPEMQRQQVALRIMTRLEDADNAAVRFNLGDGTTVRWRDATEDQKAQITNRLIDRWVDVISNQVGQTESLPKGWEQFNLTREQASQLEVGKRYPLRDASGKTVGYVANRDGTLVRLDASGKVIDGQP